jgi:hypothetical protein
MGNVVVVRRHVNGNYTAGWYLIDLLCLGVKDTFYMFNVPPEVVDERLELVPFLQEAEYNLVHNIVYAGHDYALEFDIKPHKDFEISRFILEDDEAVPLIEIPVGDEEGKPYLLVDRFYNFPPILQKLKQNPGEGNYTFTLRDDGAYVKDDVFDDEAEFDEDEDELDEDFNEDEEDGFEESLDFDVARDMSLEELQNVMWGEEFPASELPISRAELLLRDLNKMENGVIENLDRLKETKDFKLFDKKHKQWLNDYFQNKEALEKLIPSINSIHKNAEGLDEEGLMKRALDLVEMHKDNDLVSYLLVNALPLLTVLAQFALLEERFANYTPSVQLFIAAHAVLLNKTSNAQYDFIINASTVEMAYPFNRSIHASHHKMFWLVKALDAYRQNDKQKLLYYHNLIRIVGCGGVIKYLYAAQLVSWLTKYMGIDDEEEDIDEE